MQSEELKALAQIQDRFSKLTVDGLHYLAAKVADEIVKRDPGEPAEPTAAAKWDEGHAHE